MSDRTVTLSLGAHVGETRCIAVSLDDGCCPWLRVSGLGQLWTCHLWHPDQLLDEVDGCLVRWAECRAAEVGHGR